jgi:hypothetical protein
MWNHREISVNSSHENSLSSFIFTRACTGTAAPAAHNAGGMRECALLARWRSATPGLMSVMAVWGGWWADGAGAAPCVALATGGNEVSVWCVRHVFVRWGGRGFSVG